MNTFTIHLQDSTHGEEITGVSSFVGEDSSGSFGILAGHVRLMTVLVSGLARFRVKSQPWQYLALPGAVVYFHNNTLTLSTRRYLISPDHTSISTALRQELLMEEEKLRTVKESLHRMEEALLKQLWDVGRGTSNVTTG